MRALATRTGRQGLARRIAAVLASAALVLSQLIGAAAPTVALAAESGSWFDNPEGTRYIGEVVGVTREQVVAELEAHESDTFYLGTPYVGLGDTGGMPRPNGDHGSYRAGMQCTGFVCYVMAAAGGSPYAALSTNGANWWNANVWERICEAKDVVSYRFDTKEELLASGLAQRGDIIVATPDSSVPVDGTDRYGNSWDGHAGFFWGSSPSEDLMWQSVHSSNGFGTIESGNQKSEIQGKVWPSHYILIPLGPSRGRVTVRKASSDPGVTDGNALYSVEGATYGLFSDEACTQDTGVRLTTRADGTSEAAEVAPGTYWARELSAPRGYALSDEAVRVEVPAGGEAEASSADTPQANPLGVVLAKVDAENGEASPLGAGTLAGAEFEVRYYAGDYDEGSLPAEPTRTWAVTTGEDGTADLSSATGDELYRDASGNAVIPLGTVAIWETRAPEGYKASGGTFVTHVTAEGTSERVSTYAAPTVAEQVSRGDLELVKAESGSMRRLAGVPFRITSATTGESHVIVTDENGQAGTAASWNAHTSRTNANDSAAEGSWDASAGVWFSGAAGRGTAPDDSKGALPYDTYTVEELRCAANEGLRLVSVTVTVSRDATTVDLGTMDDDEGPRIATTLTGEGGEHLAEAAGKVTLTDEVAYENLVPGQEYELTGTLVDRGTGEAVTNGDGSPVTAKTKLVPKLSSGKAKVTFELDASGLAGRSVVAFEELSQGGTTVAKHADVDDSDQTVLFPRIGTTATDAEDGSHEAAAGGDVTITDEVAYENLVPGKEYELTGTLMDRETGEAVTGADGRAVTSTTRLTPESGSGTAAVTFSFDGSALAGRTVVAFETLSLGGREYAAHADLSDQGQTVTFPSVRTTACDASDGDKVIDAAPGQKVTDTVAYSNLVPGATYRLTGRLVDRDSGEELATAEAEIAPESATGTAEVAFDVDGSGLEG
ncbi:VaFE repeat-containing surface-anchored protein, partial [Olsenella sp. AM30-3LB]|uniref:VaFE repeat-containing surface-anchored protein n=1 Tax=Olsenella sp. AM30-3LB TaxID=2292359 RepID=UPI0018F79590